MNESLFITKDVEGIINHHDRWMVSWIQFRHPARLGLLGLPVWRFPPKPSAQTHLPQGVHQPAG